MTTNQQEIKEHEQLIAELQSSIKALETVQQLLKNTGDEIEGMLQRETHIPSNFFERRERFFDGLNTDANLIKAELHQLLSDRLIARYRVSSK